MADYSVTDNKKKVLDKTKLSAFLYEFDYYYIIAPLCLMAVLFVFGAFTGKWIWSDNPYRSFALQADAWLNGRLDLENGADYTYLELAIYNGKYFVSFPPFPSYVLLPIVFFTGINAPDGYVNLIFSLVGIIYAYKLGKALLGEDKKDAAFILALLAYIGSNTMYFISTSWVWFFAQNLSFTLSIMALYYAVKGMPGWSLAFWACAVGCRPFQVLFLPVMVLLLVRCWKDNEAEYSFFNKIKKEWYKGIPCAVIALSYCILNYARFGNITEFGHNYLPEFTREENGQFSFAYLAGNLKNMFRLPVSAEGSDALNFYNCDGVAFWLVNPIFVLLIITVIYRICKVRNRDTLISVLVIATVCVHIVLLCMHRTLGGWHFGNRYTCDAIPLALTGILLSIPRDKRFLPVPKLIFVFGFALNIVGTVAAYNNWL